MPAAIRLVFISVRSEIILDHLSILHDKADAFDFRNVSDRISRDRHDIGKFPGLDGANTVLPTEHFRGVRCHGAYRFEGRRSCKTQVDKRAYTGLAARLARIKPAHVGSRGKFDT